MVPVPFLALYRTSFAGLLRNPLSTMANFSPPAKVYITLYRAHSNTVDLNKESYANFKEQSSPGCLHVTHYIILYLIPIYYYLIAKLVISNYDKAPDCKFLT